MVEEKTILQAELRSAKEQYELIAAAQTKVFLYFCFFFSILLFFQSQNEKVSFQMEQELRNLKSKLEQSNALLKAQTGEMENLRRTYAEAQAKNLSVQNEKSEAQVRIETAKYDIAQGQLRLIFWSFKVHI